MTDAKQAAIEQWNADPCESFASTAEVGTLTYFHDIVRVRNATHGWMPELIGYAGTRGKRVLDVGCGQGIDLVQYAAAGARVTGADITPRHLELARRHLDALGLPGEVVRADAENLPFADGEFDHISSNGVLHHTTDISAALREVRRVLKPGGRAVIIVYNRSSFHYWLNQFLFMGIMRRQLLQERSMAGVLSANVERSTVGARPLVNVYSPRELRRLMRDAGFAGVHTTVRQFQADDVVFYGELAKRIGFLRRRRILDAVGRLGGWYVIGTATAAEPDGLGRLRALSHSPYPPEPPRRHRRVDLAMRLASRGQRQALDTPHLSGGEDVEKCRYEYAGAEELWSSFPEGIDGSALRGKDVLDVGCGWGGKDVYYAEHHGVRSIAGFDLEGAFDPEVAEAFARERGVAGATFTTGFAETIPFADESFDVALLDDVLEHVADPAAVLAECRRVLRPGGLLLAKFPSLRMMRAHHLDRAITWPALHWVAPLKVWAAGLNHHLLRSGAGYEPFDEVVEGPFGRTVTRNLNGMDLAAFREVAQRSGLEQVHLDLVGYEGPAAGGGMGKFRLYGALRALPGLREPLSVSIAYVGRRSADASR